MQNNVYLLIISQLYSKGYKSKLTIKTDAHIERSNSSEVTEDEEDITPITRSFNSLQ